MDPRDNAGSYIHGAYKWLGIGTIIFISMTYGGMTRLMACLNCRQINVAPIPEDRLQPHNQEVKKEIEDVSKRIGDH